MTTRARAGVLLTSSLVAVTLLAGCGGDDAPESASSGTSATSPASTTTAEGSASTAPATASTDGGGGTAEPPFPADASADTGEPSADARVTVHDIRLGPHEGFDRVVFEIGGTGTPGWEVRYVDQPSSQGSGHAVEVAGAAVLQVTLTGAGYPYDTGVEEYSAEQPLTAPFTEAVVEVVFDHTFEGQTVAFVGTAARTPFRAYLLENSTRLVLDVSDPG